MNTNDTQTVFNSLGRALHAASKAVRAESAPLWSRLGNLGIRAIEIAENLEEGEKVEDWPSVLQWITTSAQKALDEHPECENFAEVRSLRSALS